MRTVLLALALFTLVVASAGPALAQGALAQSEANVKAPDPGSTVPEHDDNTLYSGPYAVTEDGALIFGGDTVQQCEDLVRLGASAKPGSEAPTANGYPVEPLTREAVELCAKAGFLPEGAVLDAETDSGTVEASGHDVLPTTGGSALSALMLGATTLAAATIILVRGIRR